MDDISARSPRELLDFELPETVWEGRDYTSIYCAVLFADLENSVQISRIVSPAEYDALIDEFQAAMLRVVDELPASLNLQASEVAVAGDQLAVFFYDVDSIKRNYLLDGPNKPSGPGRVAVIKDYRKANESLAFAALRAAVYIKNAWLTNPVNVARVVQHREPYGLAQGVHLGKVYLRRRADGKRRVEGYTVNMAKRIEAFSRHGRFSGIMFSRPTCNMIRGTVVKHTQLRERIFFHHHHVESDVLKGLGRTDVFELKFYHLIGIPRPTEQLVELYRKIFAIEETNIWAYYQLSDYYRYVENDMDKVFELAQRAYLVYPGDEKVLHDIAIYYLHHNMLEQAREYCLQALAANPELGLSHETLAVIYNRQQDHAATVENARRTLLLSPGSPASQINMGAALSEIGAYHEAAHHIANAIAAYPDYLTDQPRFAEVLAQLERLAQHGAISPQLRAAVAAAGPQYLPLLDAAVVAAPDAGLPDAE